MMIRMRTCNLCTQVIQIVLGHGSVITGEISTNKTSPYRAWLRLLPHIYTMSEPVWKVAVNRNFDFQSFAICQNFRKKMNEDVHNLPDDEPSIFFDVQTRL